MRPQAPGMPDHPSRPIGVMVVAACLAVYGLQSLAGGVQLFPLWLESARHHRYGNEAFAWMELISGVAALAGAYGLWRQRRWARFAALVVVLLAIASLCLIAAFSIGEAGGGSAWLVAGTLFLLAGALSVWVLRYIWRHT